jgi:hypothetical protein
MAKHALAKGLIILAASILALDCAAADRPVFVAIRLIGNFAVVTANIDGSEVPLVFDSGSSASVSLTQEVIDRVKALPTGEASRGMDAKGNVLKYPKFKIHRIQIGSADVEASQSRWHRFRSIAVCSRGFVLTAWFRRAHWLQFLCPPRRLHGFSRKQAFDPELSRRHQNPERQ